MLNDLGLGAGSLLAVDLDGSQRSHWDGNLHMILVRAHEARHRALRADQLARVDVLADHHGVEWRAKRGPCQVELCLLE